MSDDPLSQAEIDSLLGAVADGPLRSAPATRPAAAQSSPGHSDSAPPAAPAQGARPRRLNPGQIRAVRGLHERFCHKAASALSALLRSAVELKLTDVEERSYSEFVFGLDSPSCFNVLRAEHGVEPLVLDISPAIVFPLIDRLLGGTGGEASPSPRRPLTEIELRLVARITQVLVRELQHAWQDAQPLRLCVEQVASDPQITELMPPNTAVLRIGMALAIRGACGTMTLCIPLAVVQPVAERLAASVAVAATQIADNPPPPTAENARSAQDSARGAMVELTVQLAETTITPQELLELVPGDLITTHQSVAEPAMVRVEGLPKFRARIGHIDGHRAIRIEERIRRAESTEPGS